MHCILTNLKNYLHNANSWNNGEQQISSRTEGALIIIKSVQLRKEGGHCTQTTTETYDSTPPSKQESTQRLHVPDTILCLHISCTLSVRQLAIRTATRFAINVCRCRSGIHSRVSTKQRYYEKLAELTLQSGVTETPSQPSARRSNHKTPQSVYCQATYSISITLAFCFKN